MKKAFLVLLGILVCLSLGLTACSKPEPNNEEITGETSEPPKMKLVAVGEATFAPFEYMDITTNKPTGFDVDLIKAIGEASGFDVEYKNIDWNSLIPALQNKEADLIVSGMTVTDERALEVTFSDPYFTSGQAWAVPKNSPIKQLSDLSGKSIAVQINTTADYAAQTLHEKFTGENQKGINIKRLKNAADVFNELKTGAVDAIICDLPVIQEYLKNNPEDEILIPEPAFTVEYYGIAMRKADKEIHDLVNKGLAKIKADGTYDEIYEKYFGKQP
ncbi:MAG: basic amino acid ABC transporter substrate-binding protein [Bacillota bacterium]|nr:basic amino acid ABC transporter substrate-binding protein [Candidatus Fermentithermobacillaceae bacterium]